MDGVGEVKGCVRWRMVSSPDASRSFTIWATKHLFVVRLTYLLDRDAVIYY